jgi:hypothetical protein
MPIGTGLVWRGQWMACLQRDVTDERRMDGMGRKNVWNVWNVWNVRIRQSGYQVVRKSFMQNKHICLTPRLFLKV